MGRAEEKADTSRRAFLHAALLSTAALPVAAVEAKVEMLAPKPVYDDIREHLDHII